jgi:hypothetical protein
MEFNKMMDIVLEMRQWLVKQGIGQAEGEIICSLCADRIRCERYYNTFDMNKVQMRLKR